VPGEGDLHANDGGPREVADDPAMQVGEGAVDEDMIDAVFKDWHSEKGLEATELLNLFLIHGTEPSIARLKVTDFFSPPRVTEQLGALPDLTALAPGSTFDLRAEKDGRSWDFLRADHRQEVRQRIAQERPYLVVGSPPCTDFSVLFRNLCAPRMNQEEVRRRRIRAEILLRFAAEIYMLQLSRGDHFLHEHPLGADSWSVPCIRRLREDPRVGEVTRASACSGRLRSP